MSDRRYNLPGLDGWIFSVSDYGPMLWHRGGELTFSQRLNRLTTNTDWRGVLARWIAKYLLDWVAPGGQHIHPKVI